MPLLLAMLALAFIFIMLRAGSLPETRQLVKFAARGVLTIPPEQVRSVALSVDEHTATFVRLPDTRWALGEKRVRVNGELLAHLQEAILVMHTSGPVRVIPHDEYRDTALQEFGLQPPRCSVVLSDGQHTRLEARFGASNPQDVLQYMQLAGGDEVYLMSRFVGEAWEHLWEHVQEATGWR